MANNETSPGPEQSDEKPQGYLGRVREFIRRSDQESDPSLMLPDSKFSPSGRDYALNSPRSPDPLQAELDRFGNTLPDTIPPDFSEPPYYRNTDYGRLDPDLPTPFPEKYRPPIDIYARILGETSLQEQEPAPPVLRERGSRKMLPRETVNGNVEGLRMRFVGTRLRENPHLRSLLGVVRQTQDLFEGVEQMASRKVPKLYDEAIDKPAEEVASLEGPSRKGRARKKVSEFVDAAVRPGETSRVFTALLAGIAGTERGRGLLDLTIDRSVDAESADLKERIRRGE